jgi:uncharacterized protein (DUF885 family)
MASGENDVVFDIRTFHDTALGSGSLTMSMLEAKIDRWIESVLASNQDW